LTLKSSEEGTDVGLVQTGVPEEEFERTEAGWRTHYFERMKMLFGFVNIM